MDPITFIAIAIIAAVVGDLLFNVRKLLRAKALREEAAALAALRGEYSVKPETRLIEAHDRVAHKLGR